MRRFSVPAVAYLESLPQRSNATVASHHSGVNLLALIRNFTSSNRKRGLETSMCTNSDRLRHIADTCQTMYAGRSPPFNSPLQHQPYRVTSQHLFVSDEHRLLVCVPFKSGSSSTLTMLAHNSEHFRSTPNATLEGLYIRANQRRFGIKLLSDYSAPETRKRLEQYRKLIVVRHPLVRVLSFYADKLSKKKNGTRCNFYFQNGIGRKAILWARGKLTSHERQCSDTLTFGEFMAYMSQHLSSVGMEHHLVPYHKWCSPCHIKYDYVMKLETGVRDQEHVIKHFLQPALRSHANKLSYYENSFLGTRQDTAVASSFQQWFSQYRDVPPAVFKIIEQHYKQDMQLFGYDAVFNATQGLLTKCGATRANDSSSLDAQPRSSCC